VSNNNYCSRCGAPLQAGALYCHNCGLAVPTQPSGTVPPPTGGPSSTQQHPTDWREQRRQWRAQRRAEHYEKYEKGEKHSEKAEKGRTGGGLIGPIIGGSILIWLGISFFLQQGDYLPSSDWWAYFLAGLGIIIIIQGLVSYGRYRGPYVGSFIGGAILFLIGIAFITNITADFWPIILIIIGIAILASSLGARRRRPPPPSAAGPSTTT
jgi:hypothetical protein